MLGILCKIYTKFLSSYIFFFVIARFRYPATKYPVLAFSGPPGNFPGKFYFIFLFSCKFYSFNFYLANQEHIPLIKYFVYSDYIREKANKFLDKHNILPDNLLAIHLRNGVDFVSVCIQNEKSNHIFS